MIEQKEHELQEMVMYKEEELRRLKSVHHEHFNDMKERLDLLNNRDSDDDKRRRTRQDSGETTRTATSKTALTFHQPVRIEGGNWICLQRYRYTYFL